MLSFHIPAPLGHWLRAGKVNSWALPCKGKGTPVAEGQASGPSHVQAAGRISTQKPNMGSSETNKGIPGDLSSALTVSTTCALPISGNGIAILLVAQAPNPGVILDLLCLTPPSNPLANLVGNTFKIYPESDHFFKVTFKSFGKVHITYSSVA